MNIKTGIEKAIEGGWLPEELLPINKDSLIFEMRKHRVGWYLVLTDSSTKGLIKNSIAGILLDPKFWQALGKSEGWSHVEIGEISNYEEEWKHKQILMILDIQGGKTIEEAFDLATQ